VKRWVCGRGNLAEQRKTVTGETRRRDDVRDVVCAMKGIHEETRRPCTETRHRNGTDESEWDGRSVPGCGRARKDRRIHCNESRRYGKLQPIVLHEKHTSIPTYGYTTMAYGLIQLDDCDCFGTPGMDSIGSACPRDSDPMFGMGSSSRRPLFMRLDCIPLPLRGRVCGQPVVRPYPPSGAESLRPRPPFLLMTWSSGFVRCRLRP
jgi:hypothetical protein